MVAGMIGSVLGTIGSSALSMLGSNNNNSGNWFDNHPLESAIFSANLSKQMQKDLMSYQYDLNSQLAQRQFEYNKYFTEHGHQAEVADLRAAGLNPVLSANNGAYSQAGLGSVGLGSASTPDIMQGSSAMSNAKSQRAMARIAGANALSDLMVKKSTSALQNSEANVNNARVHNVNMDTELKASQITLNNVEKMIKDVDYKIRNKDYSSYDVRLKNELENTRIRLIQAQASMIGANAQKTSAHSNAIYNARRASGQVRSETIKMPSVFGVGGGSVSHSYTY